MKIFTLIVTFLTLISFNNSFAETCEEEMSKGNMSFDDFKACKRKSDQKFKNKHIEFCNKQNYKIAVFKMNRFSHCEDSQNAETETEKIIANKIEEIDEKEIKAHKSRSCPKKVAENSGCDAFHIASVNCSKTDQPEYICQNRAFYIGSTPEGIKQRCQSPDIDSCILFKKTLVDCFNKSKSASQCITAGNAYAKMRDEIKSHFGDLGAEATMKFEACLESKKKTHKQCKDVVLSYMGESYPSFGSDCSDLMGKQSGYCGNAFYEKKGGMISDMDEMMKEMNSELENTFPDSDSFGSVIKD